jgi:septal ring factor EnvC (AmiA/AmiB activator)
MERMKHTGDYELDRINMLEQECADLEEENKKLKETIKDHQLYEKKLEQRIIEFEELLH